MHRTPTFGPNSKVRATKIRLHFNSSSCSHWHFFSKGNVSLVQWRRLGVTSYHKFTVFLQHPETHQIASENWTPVRSDAKSVQQSPQPQIQTQWKKSHSASHIPSLTLSLSRARSRSLLDFCCRNKLLLHFWSSPKHLRGETRKQEENTASCEVRRIAVSAEPTTPKTNYEIAGANAAFRDKSQTKKTMTKNFGGGARRRTWGGRLRRPVERRAWAPRSNTRFQLRVSRHSLT